MHPSFWTSSLVEYLCMASKISMKISHSSSNISKVILPYLKKKKWCKYTVVFSSWYIDFAWGLWILHKTLFWQITSLSQILSIANFFSSEIHSQTLFYTFTIFGTPCYTKNTKPGPSNLQTSNPFLSSPLIITI